jgi:hypothetical protein
LNVAERFLEKEGGWSVEVRTISVLDTVDKETMLRSL